PLRFEENRGQAEAGVRFVSRSPEHVLTLSPEAAVLQLASGRLEITLPGGNQNPKMDGVGAFPSFSGYFFGDNPEAWQTRVAHFSKVRYSEVYPGIDLVYYGKGRQLEHDFVIAPGADPSRIRMRFDGAGSLDINPQGDLVLDVGGAAMRFSAPYIYTDSDQGRVQVAGRFQKLGEREIGFLVQDYDPSQPLVIDPVLSYSTYLGGTVMETVTDVFVDESGFIWLTGITWSNT
ncbi:MAG: hypothetical protein GY953_30380, partial [bacterium]|nr:hypothetical protein [bacterium]